MSNSDLANLFLVIVAAAVGWKLYQLAKAPRDAPLRSVTLCLVCAAVSYRIAMPDGSSGLDTVAGGTTKLVQNLLLLAAAYFLMCFYLYSAADAAVSRRRARREAMVVLAVAVIITAMAATVRQADFARSSTTADMAVPQIAVFYLVAGLYLMYALAVAGRWTRRYALMSQRPHSTGLWLAATGLFAMATACAIRAVFVAIRWAGHPVSGPLMIVVAALLVISIALFVIGITYPGVRTRASSVRLWLQHRRTHRRLEPLWLLLSEAYPQSVLRSTSLSWRTRRRARGVHRRYHRRVVECRDGLVHISPYLYENEPGDAILDGAPEDLARRLRRAAAAASEDTPTPRTAVPVAVPQGNDRDADVRQLVALSDALRTTS